MSWTVVIADDEAPLRGLLRILIERDGRFAVLGEAADGRATLTLVDELDPDLLVLDLGLPELDGLQVLERLGDRPRPRTVVLTGFDDPTIHATARELGAVSCLTKGRDFTEVLDVLAAAAG
jgi:DNA-binding NarL/FixJ family response regulator